MKLLIQERVLLQQLLPQKENLLKMILIDDIIQQITFTPEEIEKYNIKETNGYLSWNTKEEREFKFSKEQIDILLSIVKKLDDANEITLQNLELAKKIYEYANPANQITS
jgi:hypothetical protein